MQTNTVTAPTNLAPAHSPAPAGRLVTDAPTRMFHWLFALSFLGAYLSADGERWRVLHVTLGYTMLGLICFRVLYGIFGPRPARLSVLWRKLRQAPSWLHAVAQSRSPAGVPWRQGQNLLMTLAVVALLALVLPLTFSGHATYNDWGNVFEDVHEFFANTFLAVVLGHLALIVGLSVLRRKNQAAPMLHGRVEGAGPDLVKNNRAWLAVALLAAVIAFWAWEWQQAPNVPISGSSVSGESSHRSRDRHGEAD